MEQLESKLELLCLTGVEDKLQTNVKQTLELLRNAGVKIWMLTGDKQVRSGEEVRTNRLGVVRRLESKLELLCLTGVEDELQTNVKQTLELLRNAGAKI